MFPNLRAEMARVGIKTKHIMELLEVNRRTAQNRLNGKVPPTLPEMLKIRDAFFPDMTIDYLFSTTKTA